MQKLSCKSVAQNPACNTNEIVPWATEGGYIYVKLKWRGGEKKNLKGGSVHALHFGQGKVCLDRVRGWGWGLGDQFGAVVGINCTNSNRHLCVTRETQKWNYKWKWHLFYLFLNWRIRTARFFWFACAQCMCSMHVLNACAQCMCSKLSNKKQK